MPKSASCSDITGTNDTSTAPTAQQCKDANTALHAARVTREKYPVYVDDQYKNAAAAARAAGDTQLELSILREATSPPAPQPPLEDEACAEPAREAAPYIKGAEAIEKEDPSCAGLLQAAENYFTAGRIFFQALKTQGLTNKQIEASCENKKTNEMFRFRDALIDLVDRKKEAGQCQSRPRVTETSPPPTRDKVQPDQCKATLDQLARTRKELEARSQLNKSIDDHDDDLATRTARMRKALQDALAQKDKATDDRPHGSEGTDYVEELNTIDVSIVELAAKGCREPGFKCSQGMRLKASLAWHDQHVPESEIHARMVAAGCSEQ
jgi:hypothetical protein